MDLKKRGRLFSWFFIATFVFSIPAVGLYGPALKESDFVLGSGSNTSVLIGAYMETLLVIANIGTAIALYPIVRKRFPALSISYVACRIVESVAIAVGVVSVLAIVTLKADFTGGNSNGIVAAAQSLVAVHDWTFWLGPGMVVGIGNGLILGYMMYKSGLVPRRMARLGLIGGPLLFLSSTLVLFGVFEQMSGPAFVLAACEIVWEASLGIYAAKNGFRQENDIIDVVAPVALAPAVAV